MSKEMTVLLIGILSLLADFLCVAATIQNPHLFTERGLAAIFTLEILTAGFCLFLIYFLAKRIVIKRRRFLPTAARLHSRFSPVLFWRFDRLKFPPRFWKRSASWPES